MTGLDVRCEHLHHRYAVDGEDVVALHDVDLLIRRSTAVAILGASGSGKSTLLTILAGLQRPTGGRVLLRDWDLTAASERELLGVRAQHLAVVVQQANRNLLPYATTLQNVRFAQRGPRAYGRRVLPRPEDLVERLDLGVVRDVQVDRLSGGERQRVALAAAVATAPDVLLIDEPTSQLDGVNRDAVLDLLARVSEEFGTTLIAVTHDATVAERFDRRILLEAGRVVDDR